MSLLALVPAALCLGLCLIPAWLLRRAKYARVQDYFIASEHTPPAVIQNASVACSLWMAALGPFFGWGATGNFWPSLVAAVCFPLGLSLMSCVRAPLLAFIDDALIHDRSVTIHQFIAQRHGNNSRLRLLAAALTVVAFAALAIGAAFALARSLAAGLDAAVPTSVLALCMLILAGGYALIVGNTGVLRSTQLQLGMIYFGLIGAAALLLYELISDLTQLPPYGIFGIVFVAAFCSVLVGYRRSRYVDTSPIRKTFDAADPVAAGREPLSARLLVRFEKILNVCISILAVFAVVVALMGLSAIGWSNVARDFVAAIGRGADISGLALVAVCLLLLFYPLVDATNWQRIAALEKDAAERASPAEARSAGLLRLFRRQGVECALVFAFTAALGSLAVATMGPSSLTSGLDDVFQQLAAGQNLVEVIAGAFLLIGLLAIVLSAMSALLSASLCALRYDVVPLLIAGPPSTGSPVTDDSEPEVALGRAGRRNLSHRFPGRRRGRGASSEIDEHGRLAVRGGRHTALLCPPGAGTDHRRHRQRLRAGEPGVGDGDHLRGLPRYRMRRRPLPGHGRRVVAVGRDPRQSGAERPVVCPRPAVLETRDPPLSHEAHVKFAHAWDAPASVIAAFSLAGPTSGDISARPENPNPLSVTRREVQGGRS